MVDFGFHSTEVSGISGKTGSGEGEILFLPQRRRDAEENEDRINKIHRIGVQEVES
jgi:hypothetical protein